MTLVGQPQPSPALQKGYDLLSQGKTEEAEEAVKKAAKSAKAQHGSGSHPLALAYADLARLHTKMGDFEKAAKEFQHAAGGPMPADPKERRDRLAFMFGFGAALGDLGKFDESEKVLRQCLAFARNLYGSQSPMAHVALVPLADVLLRAGKTGEGAKFANEAYDALWKLGDPLFPTTVGTRAEAFKATGKADYPFGDLADLPDDMVTAAVATTLGRAGKSDVKRVRAVLGDLLKFVKKKYGDGHDLTSDTYAAVAHHEAAAGDKGDAEVRKKAVSQAVYSYAVRRVADGLLANLEVEFEPGGTIHLAPHLSREPNAAESAQIESILTDAVNDLYSRPTLRP